MTDARRATPLVQRYQNFYGTGFEPDAGRGGSQAGGRQNQRGRGHYRSGQPGELDSGDTGVGGCVDGLSDVDGVFEDELAGPLVGDAQGNTYVGVGQAGVAQDAGGGAAFECGVVLQPAGLVGFRDGQRCNTAHICIELHHVYDRERAYVYRCS